MRVRDLVDGAPSLEREGIETAVAAVETPESLIEVPRPELPPYATKLEPPSRYKILYGGRGAARSWTVARMLLWRAARRPMRVLCAREIQASIADSVHQLLGDQIELLGMHQYRLTQTAIRHTVTKSLFMFHGLRHNAKKLKSLEGADVCWVEEAEAVSADSWKTLIPTIRRPGSEIWVTFNADLETDPTFKLVTSPRPSSLVLKVGHEDNPWFPDELRMEMEHDYATDPEAAAWIWGGECRQATDAQVLKGKWRVESFEPQPDWMGPYQGMDFGFARDPAGVWRCWVEELDGSTDERPRRRLYIEREAYRVGLELDDTAAFLTTRIPECEKYVTRADSARPESISYLKRHGMPRIEAVEKWGGSVEDGVAHLRSYTEIVIHPRCELCKREARLWSYKTDRLTGDVLPVLLDKHNHSWDGIRYALAPLIRITTRRFGVYYPGASEVNGSNGQHEEVEGEPQADDRNGDGAQLPAALVPSRGAQA